jgi:hypothetical protein
VSYRIENGETIVPLTLTSEQSLHVVFRKPATRAAMAIKKLAPVEIGRVDGPWQVAFEAGRGAPAKATFSALTPLNEHSEAGIRYFSGTATYTNSFSLPGGWRSGQPLWLDLGNVREVAEVSVNGQLAGYAWHAPYRVDVGQAAKPGHNVVEIRVANLWVNRLIGDKQAGEKPVTWTSLPTYVADAPLRQSGLICPVLLFSQK